MNNIILASSSPRRKILLKALLNNFGLKFIIKPANIVEYIEKGEKNYSLLVRNLAQRKAIQVAKRNKGIIIAADTIVVHRNIILGKPNTREDAFYTLRLLSGKWHKVFTGLYIMDTENLKRRYSVCEVTKVKFRRLVNKEIEFYVNNGSPFDKAGAYGIQDDFGSTFIERIEGDYFNVVGLPLLKTYIGLKKIINFK